MIFESHLDKDSCERLMYHFIRVILDLHQIPVIPKE